MRDSDRILGMLGSKTKRAIEGGEPVKEHLLITATTQPRGRRPDAEPGDIQDILRIKLIGVIPESEVVLQSSNQGTPAIHAQGAAMCLRAYKDVIDRLPGPGKALRFIEGRKARLLQTPVREQISHGFLLSSFLIGEKKKPPALPKNACRSSWRTSATAATPPSPTPARPAARLVAVISKYVKITPKTSRCNWSARTTWKCSEVKIELPDTVR